MVLEEQDFFFSFFEDFNQKSLNISILFYNNVSKPLVWSLSTILSYRSCT